MLRSTVASQSDPRAVLVSHEFQRSTQCFSLSLAQQFLAVGTHHEVRVMALRLDGGQRSSVNELCSTAHAKQSVVVVDLCWGLTESSQFRLAVSYSNGELKVFTLTFPPLKSTRAALHQEWVCDKSEQGDARVAARVKWHPVDVYSLFTAHYDGAVRVFDTRVGGATRAISVFKGKRSALRDLSFSPFHPDLFADVGDGGVLR
jgi:WD40 repeat protein